MLSTKVSNLDDCVNLTDFGEDIDSHLYLPIQGQDGRPGCQKNCLLCREFSRKIKFRLTPAFHLKRIEKIHRLGKIEN
jgi:hypothetical protein